MSMYFKFKDNGRVEGTSQVEIEGYELVSAELAQNGAYLLKTDTGEYRRQTDEEIAADEAAYVAETNGVMHRHQRNVKLADSDWVVTKALESGGSVPADWVTYRTALRDLPEHSNWPNLEADDWPTQPSS
tara:strand:- start:1063 stop:1452 length:390 start_codon:yes stop_codon:yes gene_type:complete